MPWPITASLDGAARGIRYFSLLRFREQCDIMFCRKASGHLRTEALKPGPCARERGRTPMDQVELVAYPAVPSTWEGGRFSFVLARARDHQVSFPP